MTRPARWRESAEIVLNSSLPDDEALESAASPGPNGILAGLAADKLWVDVSTWVSPRVSRARPRGQVSAARRCWMPPGFRERAAGAVGKADDHGRRRGGCLPSRRAGQLRELGTPTHVGENGQGLALKLAINISLAVQMLAYSEGLLLATHSGVDPKIATRVMTESPIGSPMLKARAPFVLDLPEEAWRSDVSLMHKDISAGAGAGSRARPTASVSRRGGWGALGGRAAWLWAARHRGSLPGARKRSGAMSGDPSALSRSGEAGPAARPRTRRSSRPPRSCCSSRVSRR